MKILSLAWASLYARKLGSFLCVMAVAAGITLLAAVFLLSSALESSLARNIKNIDIIAGPPGSPLQLILSSVYHIDIPAGNIKRSEAERWAAHRDVRRAVPLALGDQYRGFRIVGTDEHFLTLYNAELAEGRLFAAAMEAVAGAQTGLVPGQNFAGVHGLMAAQGGDGHVHDDHPYKVTGILAPTGTVLDRLIITSVASVHKLHAHDHDHSHSHAHEHGHDQDITAMILQVASPVALMNLPRRINQSSNLQAAVPAYEIARISRSLGWGRDGLVILGGLFVALSMLMIFAVLAAGMAARRYDLAVMRTLGASPLKLGGLVMAEGALLGGAGALLGLLGGYGAAYALVSAVPGLGAMIVPQSLLVWQPVNLYILLAGTGAGIVAAIVPALGAARTDIATILSRGSA